MSVIVKRQRAVDLLRKRFMQYQLINMYNNNGNLVVELYKHQGSYDNQYIPDMIVRFVNTTVEGIKSNFPFLNKHHYTSYSSSK